MSQKNIAVITIILLIVVGGLSYVAFSNKPTTDLPPTQVQQTNQPTVPPLPTRTQEEIKIIAQIKDYNVDITATGFTPIETTVKTNDQVFFTNKDTKMHKVKGDNWGNVPIGPGERFVQAFKTAGVFTYTDTNDPAFTGKIIVE